MLYMAREWREGVSLHVICMLMGSCLPQDPLSLAFTLSHLMPFSDFYTLSLPLWAPRSHGPGQAPQLLGLCLELPLFPPLALCLPWQRLSAAWYEGLLLSLSEKSKTGGISFLLLVTLVGAESL